MGDRPKLHPSVRLVTRKRLSRNKNVRLVVIYIWPDDSERRRASKGEEEVRTRGLRKHEFDKLQRAFEKRHWPPLGYASYDKMLTVFAFEIARNEQVGAVQALMYADLVNLGIYVPSDSVTAMTR